MGGVSNGGVHFQSAVCLVPAPAVGQGGSACFLSRPTRGLPCVLALMNGSFVQPRRQRCDCCCRAGRQEKHSTDFTAFRSAFTPTNGRHTPIMKWSAGLSSHRKGETPASQFQKKNHWHGDCVCELGVSIAHQSPVRHRGVFATRSGGRSMQKEHF